MGGDDYRPPPEPKPDAPQNELATWAILEIFGHQKYAGFVQSQAFGSTVMFRLDVPDLPERIGPLELPTWVTIEATGARQYAPAGTVIKAPEKQGYSKIFGASAIYCITPCTEDAARAVIQQMSPRPLMLVKMPGAAAELAAPIPIDF
jgi:hypothetical protein